MFSSESLHDVGAKHDACSLFDGYWELWIGLATRLANDPKVKKELRVPDDHEVYSELIFGLRERRVRR